MRRPALLLLTLLAAAWTLSGGCGEPRSQESSKPQFSVTVRVSRFVRGELKKLMLRLESPNWHERFVAAYELRQRGHDVGLGVIRSGMYAEEWFVRADAARYSGACEAFELFEDVFRLLKDEHAAVGEQANRALARISCSYPSPLDADRASAWKRWREEHPDPNRIDLLKQAVAKVNSPPEDLSEAQRVEALYLLRSLDIPDRAPRTAKMLADSSSAVRLTALKLLSTYNVKNSYDEEVKKLLEDKDPRCEAYAALYLWRRGGGEELAWHLHVALTQEGLKEKAHNALVDIYGAGPKLDTVPAETDAEVLADKWKKWLITDEVLKGKRNWEDYVEPSAQPTGSGRPPSPRHPTTNEKGPHGATLMIVSSVGGSAQVDVENLLCAVSK
ncbi:MAG: hypothetical protein U5N86_10010 [Planctomycetota bacterium]|nr:hypothetical protein [Planctomycetota bacterium]